MANWFKTLFKQHETHVAASHGWGASAQEIERMEARAAAVDPARVREERPDLFEEWKAGALLPWRCTLVLDAARAEGAWVDIACGADEPEVDLWEAGKLYPSWENTVRLAALANIPLEELLSREGLGPDTSFVRCGNAIFAKELRQSFLPALVDLTVAADPRRATVGAASAIVSEAFNEWFKALIGDDA